MASPFDDPSEREPLHPALAPKPRRKRPWWQWNFITLAVVLFVLVWLRELAGISPGAIWGWVFVVFLVWLLAPIFAMIDPTDFSPSKLMERKRIERTRDEPERRSGDGVLRVLKVVATVLGVLSVLHLVVLIFLLSINNLNAGGFYFPGNGFAVFVMQLAGLFSSPALEFLGAAILYVLAEIALRMPKP